MPKTKDGYIIDDKPVEKPMTKEEAKKYIEESFKDSKDKKKKPNAR